MSNADYKYDVAFSFHSDDEGIATQLNDLLQDRFNTFLYSERQKVLAGTDGEETFNSVFREQSRCVVVFCSKEWGETPFTRIEQTAIRNRAYDHGYSFTLFIPTDKPPTIPQWLPKTQLYYGLDRFGLNGAAAVVEARIQELGGEPSIETIEDRAARLQRSKDLAQAKKQFRESEAGVDQAKEAFSELITAISEKISTIAKHNSSLSRLGLKRFHGAWELSGIGLTMMLDQKINYGDTLDGSQLTAAIFKGTPPCQQQPKCRQPHIMKPAMRSLRGRNASK